MNKDQVAYTRITEPMKKEVEVMSKKQSISQSKYIRNAIEEKLKKDRRKQDNGIING